MALTSYKRIIRSGWINFWRNGIISLASVLIVTITLFVIASLIFLQAILQNSLTDLKNKVDVTVYLTRGASEPRILELKSEIEKIPEVASVEYVSAAQALEDFKEKHKNDYITLQALEELNGNPLTASLNIRADDPSQYEELAKALSADNALGSSNASIINKVNYYQNKVVIDRLTSVIDGARNLGFGITLVLIIISIIITFTTIRLTIYFAREEIGVMRLVGAENKYIRGPFMVEGMIYGVIAAIFTAIIFIPVTLWAGKSLSSFLGMNLFQYYTSNFLQVFAIVLFSGIILGAISSFLAIRKYLRK